jgi:multiple antibiotic resistance protein
MSQELTLFVGMFTTLLAIINPLEALPVFLKLLEGKDEAEHLRVARLSCFYALLLAFFFLIFGKLILRIFGVPLSMVRIVGGIILMRIGFELFSPSSSGASPVGAASGSSKRMRMLLSSHLRCRSCLDRERSRQSSA